MSFAPWLAIVNLESAVIGEARHGAFRPDPPPRPDVPESHGIEIQRIGMLPTGREIMADVFAARSDSRQECVFDAGHRGAIAARLFGGELPGLAFVAGICRNAGGTLGILIVTADNDDFPSIPASDGEDSGRRVAVCQRSFR